MQNIIIMQQVHGNNVVRVDSKDIGTTIPQCDGLITSDPNVTLCVRVADCLPISIIDKKGRAIGLIHAGWRGLENGIIKKAIDLMNSELQIPNSELEIKIGPHICAKHYETDLVKVALSQLTELGIKKENITVDPRCTFEDKNLFSYRRNKTVKRNLIMHRKV